MSDPTLDEMRGTLARELPRHAPFDGWTPEALDRAADACGFDPAVARLAFPGGAIDMIDAWFAEIDVLMLEALTPAMLSTMKIRTRITALVEARLDIAGSESEALRRALAILALPQNLARAARLDWRAADAMWHAAGDTATDLNHYSKRAILGAVYAATVLVMVGDDSEGRTDTRAFLTRRIEGIMRFEKAKASLTRAVPDGFSLSRFLGRLRYPVS